MTNHIELKELVPESLDNQRLDQVLATLFPDYSRSQFKQWIEQGVVTVDNKVQNKPKHKVQVGQAIAVETVLVARENWQAQALELNVVFEDDDIMVINKPQDVVVHPGAGNHDSTLVNALLHYCADLATVPRAGLIHRLDKDTSGLLLIAKNLRAHTALVEMMKERQINRHYLALIHGAINVGGIIDKPIARHTLHRTKMAISRGGKPAVTHYKVKKKYQYHTLLNVTLETGRTHQIRVHLASIQHPVVGDSVYGGKRLPQKDLSEEAKQALLDFNRQALHAEKLSFIHPFTQEQVEFTAPLPDDFQNLIALLQ